MSLNGNKEHPTLVVTESPALQRTLITTPPAKTNKTNGHIYRTEIIDKARSKFAVNADKGIEFLLKHGVIENSSHEVANFLQHCGFLDKVQMGEYLANPKNRPVLEQYVGWIPMAEVSVEAALRRLLMRFKLPGEAQKIDRLLECFAQCYHRANPTVFQSKDLVYVLSFSMVLLNTDLHNPNNPRRMSKDAFITNNRAVDGGAAISTELLASIYDAIAANELMTETECHLDYTLSGPDIEGVLWKRGDRFPSWNRRWCVAVNRCLYYFYSKHDSSPRGVIPLEDLAVRPLDRRGKFRFEITPEDGDSRFMELNTRTEPPHVSILTTPDSLAVFSQGSTVRSSSSWLGDGRSFISSASSINVTPKLPLIKSAKYVNGQLVEGNRDRFVFQCATQMDRDRWVAVLKSLMVHTPLPVQNPLIT